jgi:uncharacterized membrane protein YgcG
VLVSRFDDNDPGALNRLEDLLDAYSDVRLAPKSAVLARIRANVLAEAAAMSATAAAENRLRLVESRARTSVGSRFGTRFARASFALGFAALLTLGTSIAVLAAPAGSPFYNARVFIETVMLPIQPEARFEGHEKLLQERFAEAEAAAARGDVDALAAALAAYQAEVDAATADAGTDATWLAHLQDMLAQHTATLTELATTLPEQASIEHAIDASSKAITKIEARQRPAAHPTRPPQGGGDAGSGGQADDQGGTPGGGDGSQGGNGGN